MNKKLLLTSALTLGILATGTVAYTSLSSAQEVQKDNNQTTEVETSSTLEDSVSKPSDSTEQNTPQESEMPSAELSKSETAGTLPSSTEQSTTSDTQKEETPQKNTPSKLTRMEQEHEAFADEAVKQDFYLEAPDANGKLTYVKATDEKVKELTEDAENNKVSIYQVEHNGEMISVLSIDN